MSYFGLKHSTFNRNYVFKDKKTNKQLLLLLLLINISLSHLSSLRCFVQSVQLPLPDSCRKGSINFLQPSQTSSTISSVQMFVSAQRSSVGSFQNSVTSSPVSLTVSPSLKTPSFLAQSGTYSFRICPPANQATSNQNLPGVALPGGFTLIQLPKPGVDGAAQQSEYTNTAAVAQALLPKDALFRHLVGSNTNYLGLDILASAKELLSKDTTEPEPSPELACHRMPSDDTPRIPKEEKEEVSIQQADSNLDTTSEDLSSDSSDYSGEGDEDVSVRTNGCFCFQFQSGFKWKMLFTAHKENKG